MLKDLLVLCRLPILTLGILLLGDGSFLVAQSEADAAKSGVYITSISITGLKRTKLSAAERPLRQFVGLAVEDVNINEVTAAIMATGILQPVSVEVQGEVLAVEVREKWSIFPIPIVTGGSDGIGAGLALTDTNAFGLNDQLFLAAFYHPNTFSVSAGYFSSSRGGRLPGYNGMASFARSQRHDRDQNAHLLRRFELDSLSLRTGLSFPLLENSNALTASLLFSFNNTWLRNLDSALLPPPDDLTLYGAGTELAARRNSWDGFFLSRESISVRYTFQTNFSGIAFQTVQLQGAWDKSLVPGFRFSFRTGAIFKPDAPILAEAAPGGAQVVILPKGFSAKNLVGGSAGFEKSVFKISAGTLSIAAYYQGVYAHGSVLGDSTDHGFAGMLSFYLSRLAIPALGVGIAHNVGKDHTQVFFNFGMSF